MLDFLEAERLEYTVAFGRNSAPSCGMEPLMEPVRRATMASGVTEA